MPRSISSLDQGIHYGKNRIADIKKWKTKELFDFLIQNIWQILKRFAGKSFHQAYKNLISEEWSISEVCLEQIIQVFFQIILSHGFINGQ